MKRAIFAVALISATVTLMGCNKRSDQPLTTASQPQPSAASQAQASQAASEPQTATAIQQLSSQVSVESASDATSAAAPSALARGGDSAQLQEPAIRGEFDKTRDGTEFAATIVTDKCGTIGFPEDCWQKRSVPIVGGAGFVDRTTLGLADGSYMMLDFAFMTQEFGTPPVVSIGPTYPWGSSAARKQLPDETNPDSLEPIEMKLNQKYRFGRKGNTVVYRESQISAGQKVLDSNYFLLLRECRGSVEKCQAHNEPYSELIELWHERSDIVGPEIWESGRKKQKEWEWGCPLG